MNKVFYYANDPTKMFLVTNVAQYIITFEHDFCEKCEETLDNYDFTDLNFWEITEEFVTETGEFFRDENNIRHGITIREKLGS